jgi:hypothetical protein
MREELIAYEKKISSSEESELDKFLKIILIYRKNMKKTMVIVLKHRQGRSSQVWGFQEVIFKRNVQI